MGLNGRQPVVAFTNANVAQSSMGLWSPSRLGEFAQEAGYSGFEYHPFYDLNYPAGSVVYAQKTGRLLLTSLHSSFRTNKESNEVNQDQDVEKSSVERLVSSRVGRLLMPEMVQSVDWMRAIQNRLPGRVPAVLYPQKNLERDEQMLIRSGASCRLFQPTDHVARLFGAESLQQLTADMRHRDYNGYCVDTFHVRRHYGRDASKRGPVSDIDSSLERIATQSRALHISLNRQDFASREPHIPTGQELKDALRGKYTGQLAEIIGTCLRLGNVDYAVIELTSRNLADFTGYKDRKSLRQSYKDIADGLNGYFEAAFARTAL